MYVKGTGDRTTVGAPHPTTSAIEVGFSSPKGLEKEGSKVRALPK